MADKGFRLTVLTEEKRVIDETVSSITVPGTEGYLGVLRNHAPLVTELMPGKLTVKDLAGNETRYAVSGGFLEVSRNVATMLADALERAEDIDRPRAERAAERARQRMKELGAEIDAARAEAALRRALNRMRVSRDAQKV